MLTYKSESALLMPLFECGGLCVVPGVIAICVVRFCFDFGCCFAAFYVVYSMLYDYVYICVCHGCVLLCEEFNEYIE